MLDTLSDLHTLRVILLVFTFSILVYFWWVVAVDIRSLSYGAVFNTLLLVSAPILVFCASFDSKFIRGAISLLFLVCIIWFVIYTFTNSEFPAYPDVLKTAPYVLSLILVWFGFDPAMIFDSQAPVPPLPNDYSELTNSDANDIFTFESNSVNLHTLVENSFDDWAVDNKIWHAKEVPGVYKAAVHNGRFNMDFAVLNYAPFWQSCTRCSYSGDFVLQTTIELPTTDVPPFPKAGIVFGSSEDIFDLTHGSGQMYIFWINAKDSWFLEKIIYQNSFEENPPRELVASGKILLDPEGVVLIRRMKIVGYKNQVLLYINGQLVNPNQREIILSENLVPGHIGFAIDTPDHIFHFEDLILQSTITEH